MSESDPSKFNVSYRGGEAVSVLHTNHDVRPPKSARWRFEINDGTAKLVSRTIGARRADGEYIGEMLSHLHELPFVDTVDTATYQGGD